MIPSPSSAFAASRSLRTAVGSHRATTRSASPTLRFARSVTTAGRAPPRTRAARYLQNKNRKKKKKKISLPRGASKHTQRTVVRLPEVDERPVEPYLRLLRTRLRGWRRRAGCGGAREHDGVRPDALEPLIFAETRHLPDQRVDAQAANNRVDCRPG